MFKWLRKSAQPCSDPIEAIRAKAAKNDRSGERASFAVDSRAREDVHVQEFDSQDDLWNFYSGRDAVAFKKLG